jgi:hypothetical protein
MKINHIITEFVTPQATAQDPGLEREKDVDVIIFGRMPQDFTYNSLIQALEAVLPREYPPGSSQNTQVVPSSPAERIGGEIAKRGGAVVTTKPLSIAQKVVKEFQARGIKCRIDASGLDEAVEDYAGTYSPEAITIGKKFCDQYNITDDTDVQAAVELIDAYLDEFKWRNVPVDLNVLKSKVAKHFRDLYRGMGPGPSFRKKFQEQGMAEGTAGLPDPNNFDSDNDYYDALDAYEKPQDMDADYENMDETKEKIGNMDADAFDAALSRMKKLAGAGPLRTVYDPARRVYKNVPHAVQPAQQPKKAR